MKKKFFKKEKKNRLQIWCDINHQVAPVTDGTTQNIL